uniref:Putative secreted protein n=1 Tax=Anopheles darlingi TaxID=43151 RepID=A0A2M4D902_ANODA
MRRWVMWLTKNWFSSPAAVAAAAATMLLVSSCTRGRFSRGFVSVVFVPAPSKAAGGCDFDEFHSHGPSSSLDQHNALCALVHSTRYNNALDDDSPVSFVCAKGKRKIEGFHVARENLLRPPKMLMK